MPSGSRSLLHDSFGLRQINPITSPFNVASTSGHHRMTNTWLFYTFFGFLILTIILIAVTYLVGGDKFHPAKHLKSAFHDFDSYFKADDVTTTISTTVKKKVKMSLKVEITTSVNASTVATEQTSTRHRRNISVIDNQQKIVLFWTTFFWQPMGLDFYGPGKSVVPGSDDLSLNRTCMFTNDRKLINQSEVVIFHGRDFNFNMMPEFRYQWQRWCYFLLESPVHSGFTNQAFAHAVTLGINWTMTYSKKYSDVWAPYFKLARRKPGASLKAVNDRIKTFARSLVDRTKDAVWIVSNCGTSSRREVLARNLTNYGITVDLYGGCSDTRPESEIAKMGHKEFFSQYKFYYSFENSLCDEYFTEKLGRAMKLSLDYGLIPVVYGGGHENCNGSDCNRVAPKDSYIDAESFDSLEALAQKLILVKESRKEAERYFKWHRHYERVMDNYPVFSYEAMCKKLFNEQETDCRADSEGEPVLEPCESPETTVQDLKERLGECYSPKFPL